MSIHFLQDPYGGGGWSSAGDKRESEEPPVDLGLPPKREKMERVSGDVMCSVLQLLQHNMWAITF